MLVDLNRTLVSLLKMELEPNIRDIIDISFATPDEQFPPVNTTLPAIDLFLYDVRVKPQMKTYDLWVDETSTEKDKGLHRRPPVLVECSYLITAWPSDSVPNPEEDEHHLLNEVMIALLRHSRIPEDCLQGRLKSNAPPFPVANLQPGRRQSIELFWQAVGGKLKAALDYNVIIEATLDR